MPPALQPALAFIESASQSLSLQRAGLAVLVALAYFLAIQLGLAFTLQPQQVSTLWPPNAILLASLLLTRPPQWWLFLLLVFPAHLIAQLIQHVPPVLALCWYVSNMTEVIIAAGLIKVLLNGRCPRFDYFYDVSVFLVAGVLIAPLLASFIDIAALQWLQGSDAGFWVSWRLRFISGALSTLILVPVITISMSQPLRLVFFRRWFNALNAVRVIELAILVSGLLAVTGLVFLGPSFNYEIRSILLCTVLPFLLWSAARFGPCLVNYLILGIALMAICGFQRGLGSLAELSPTENILILQLFLIVTTVPILLMTAMIYERRHAVLDARNSEEQLRTSLHAAHISSWMLDFSSDRVTWIGPQPRLLADCLEAGCSSEQLFGLVHADDRERVRHALANAVATKTPFDLEFRAPDAAGNCCWFASRGSVCCDVNGLPHHLMGIHIDITERKNETAQVLQLRQELTHLSRVAMLGELSGAVAHELNQPLTSILSNAQAALRLLDRESVQKQDIAEILADIVAEDKRADAIITRLRTLLRKGEVQLQTVDINSVIQEVIALEHSDLLARNIVVSTQLCSDVPAIRADRVQIQQVLLNLIINANDAMSGNAPSERLLEISTRTLDDDCVEIAVCDRGHGIDEGDPEKIFQAFFTSKAHGLGLGLAICRSIVSAHTGQLQARNNKYGGATFYLTLPVAHSELMA